MMCGLGMVKPHDMIAALVHLVVSLRLLRVNNHECRDSENQRSHDRPSKMCFHYSLLLLRLIELFERLAGFGSTESDSSRLARFPLARRANRSSQSLSVS